MVDLRCIRPLVRCTHTRPDRIVFADGDQHCLRCGRQLIGSVNNSTDRRDGADDGRRWQITWSRLALACLGLTMVLSFLWILSGPFIEGVGDFRDQFLNWPQGLRAPLRWTEQP